MRLFFNTLLLLLPSATSGFVPTSTCRPRTRPSRKSDTSSWELGAGFNPFGGGGTNSNNDSNGAPPSNNPFGQPAAGGAGPPSGSNPFAGPGVGGGGSSSNTNPFGQPSAAASSQPNSPFGQPASGSGAAATNSPFGQPATGGGTASNSPFGQPAAGGGATSNNSSFGQPSTGASSPSNNQFGQPAAGGRGTPLNDPFGQPASGGRAPSNNQFGQPASGGRGTPSNDPFGQPAAGSGRGPSNNQFGQPASGGRGTPSNDPFGQPAAGSGRGPSNNQFGQPASGGRGTPSNDPFGQPSAGGMPTSPFTSGNQRSGAQPSSQCGQPTRQQQQPLQSASTSQFSQQPARSQPAAPAQNSFQNSQSQRQNQNMNRERKPNLFEKLGRLPMSRQQEEQANLYQSAPSFPKSDAYTMNTPGVPSGLGVDPYNPYFKYRRLDEEDKTMASRLAARRATFSATDPTNGSAPVPPEWDPSNRFFKYKRLNEEDNRRASRQGFAGNNRVGATFSATDSSRGLPPEVNPNSRSYNKYRTLNEEQNRRAAQTGFAGRQQPQQQQQQQPYRDTDYGNTARASRSWFNKWAPTFSATDTAAQQGLPPEMNPNSRHFKYRTLNDEDNQRAARMGFTAQRARANFGATAQNENNAYRGYYKYRTLDEEDKFRAGRWAAANPTFSATNPTNRS